MFCVASSLLRSLLFFLRVYRKSQPEKNFDFIFSTNKDTNMAQ